MVDYTQVLPIGSVVLLKGADKRLMILGYQRKSADPADQKIYDYCGCSYPEGFISPEKTAIFNHDQIDRIIFMGFQNPAQASFADKLKEIIQNRERGNR